MAFHLVDDRIVLAVGLNGGKPVPFLFAPDAVSLLDPAVARRAGLRPGAAGLVMAARIEAGAVRRRDVPFGLADFAGIGPGLGVAPAGTIGEALTGGGAVQIDYAARRIRLLDGAGFQPPAGADCLPWLAGHGLPTVRATLDGRTLIARLAPDQGGAVHLPAAAMPGQAQSGAARTLVTGFSGAGPIWSRVMRGETLGLGRTRLTAPVLQAPTDAEAAPGGVASLGGAILKRFTLTFLPTRRLVCLQPNALAAQPERADRSGLGLVLGADGAPVVAVVAPATPAATAGLVPGDHILAINGRATRRMSLDAVRALLRAPGKVRLRLSIAKGKSRPRRVMLTLRDLI